MRIVIIGPVYPYKGGISHYTGLMFKALKKENEVYMLSYKLQYPSFLFKREQKDYRNDAFRIDETEYCINTVNPLNWIATARHIRSYNPELVIFQWWHPYFAPCYWIICKLLKNIKIMFLCHNVFPHERFPLDRFLTKLVLNNGDLFIVHSQQDEMDLKAVKPNAVARRTVHPTYNFFKLQNMSKEQGRECLNLTEDHKVLLFFGLVREYKGLKYLIYALPEIVKQLDHVKLLIAGDFAGSKDEYSQMISELQMEPYIEIYDSYIPDKEVEKFFAACDIVVLPYISATQSGIVQIAYGFEKPVIVTDVGGLPEVVIDNKTGYVVESQNSEQLAERIIQFFASNKAEDFQINIQQEAYKYSWDRLSEIVDELCEKTRY